MESEKKGFISLSFSYGWRSVSTRRLSSDGQAYGDGDFSCTRKDLAACNRADDVKRTDCLRDVFSFLRNSSIPFLVLRSYESLPEKFEGGDVDLVVQKDDAKQLLSFMKEHYTITAVAVHVGIVNVFIFLSKEEQLQIDVMFSLSYNGIPYLDVSSLLADRVAYQELYIPAPWHEYFVLLLPHFFYTGEEKEKYRKKMSSLLTSHPSKIAALHKQIFGHEKKRSIARFHWTNRHKSALMSDHYLLELYKYIRQPFSRTVAFLGPDGAGKSTVLQNIADLDILFAKTTSFTHLKPQYLLKRRNQNRGVVTEPHAEEPRNTWTASLKMVVYVQEYWIEHFINPQRPSHIKIYDRYMHDTIIDPRRYRLPEGGFAQRILSKLAPKPVVFIVLDADPEIIQARKAEVPLEATRKQCESYLGFARQNPSRCAVVDANQPADKVVDDIVDVMVQRLSQSADEQLEEILKNW